MYGFKSGGLNSFAGYGPHPAVLEQGSEVISEQSKHGFKVPSVQSTEPETLRKLEIFDSEYSFIPEGPRHRPKNLVENKNLLRGYENTEFKGLDPIQLQKANQRGYQNRDYRKGGLENKIGNIGIGAVDACKNMAGNLKKPKEPVHINISHQEINKIKGTYAYGYKGTAPDQGRKMGGDDKYLLNGLTDEYIDPKPYRGHLEAGRYAGWVGKKNVPKSLEF